MLKSTVACESLLNTGKTSIYTGRQGGSLLVFRLSVSGPTPHRGHPVLHRSSFFRFGIVGGDLRFRSKGSTLFVEVRVVCDKTLSFRKGTWNTRVTIPRVYPTRIRPKDKDGYPHSSTTEEKRGSSLWVSGPSQKVSRPTSLPSSSGDK